MATELLTTCRHGRFECRRCAPVEPSVGEVIEWLKEKDAGHWTAEIVDAALGRQRMKGKPKELDAKVLRLILAMAEFDGLVSETPWCAIHDQKWNEEGGGCDVAWYEETDGECRLEEPPSHYRIEES